MLKRLSFYFVPCGVGVRTVLNEEVDYLGGKLNTCSISTCMASKLCTTVFIFQFSIARLPLEDFSSDSRITIGLTQISGGGGGCTQ